MNQAQIDIIGSLIENFIDELYIENDDWNLDDWACNPELHRDLAAAADENREEQIQDIPDVFNVDRRGTTKPTISLNWMERGIIKVVYNGETTTFKIDVVHQPTVATPSDIAGQMPE